MPYARSLALPLLALLLGLAGPFAALADEPAPLTDAQRQELEAEAIRLGEEAQVFDKEGKLTEALAAGEKVLAADRRLNQHRHITLDLRWLAERYEQIENFAAAKKHRAEVLAIQAHQFGKDHWEVTDARWALHNTELIEFLPAERRRLVSKARTRNSDVVRLFGEGKLAAAAEAAKEAADIQKAILGEAHPDYATSLNNLARMYVEQGDYVRAEPLHQQALEIRKKAFGEQHPNYAASLSNLAAVYDLQRDYLRAEPLYRQALSINQKVQGEDHPSYAVGLNNLALLYMSQGDYVRAEPLYSEAVRITKKAGGDDELGYALSLNNIGSLYDAQGDYARAEAFYRHSLEIRKKLLNETHHDYALSLHNLATLYHKQGDHARAAPFYREALEITKRVFGEDHCHYALSLNNLAALFHDQRDYGQAEPLYRQALEIYKKSLGETRSDYATSLNNLAAMYDSQGDYARAEPLCRQSLEIRKQALGEAHPDYATSLNNLAAMYDSQRDYSRAEPLYWQALKISLANLELATAVQSERGQLAMAADLRYTLDSYLALAIRAGDFEPAVYERLLAWKGMVLTRQRAMRTVAGRHDLAPVASDLQATTKRLASLALVTPQPGQAEAWRTQIAELSARKEELEQKLAAGSAEFRAAIKPMTVADVSNASPEDGALVDFLEFWYSEPKTKEEGGGRKWERRIAAFVVVNEGDVQLVDLGSAAPIIEAIDAWRSGFGMDAESRAAGNILREKLWLPIEKHLASATTVLISPDGDLGKLPFAALPGKEPGTYLLEEYTLAVVPSARAIVDSAHRAEQDVARPAGESDPARQAGSTGNLLVLGGVDYDRRSDAAAEAEPPKRIFAARAVRDDADQPFVPLAGTKGELATIDRLYRTTFGGAGIHSLEGSAATQDALVAAASQHLYLHLATHGYFASPKYKSALDRTAQDMTHGGEAFVSNQSLAGYHPGLLSGIVLAGANQPTEEDDGILTAEEIGSLNLDRCELVVLSACETGLGKAAGGEGLLGLQRSFQAAGARTLVASLWNVDDDATKTLMAEFYRNLWERKLGKLESLRQAQLTMLSEYDPATRTLSRGLVDAENRTPNAKEKRLPPYFWAAFVLSGDWR